MKNSNTTNILICRTVALAAVGCQNSIEPEVSILTPKDARAIAKQACLYANPMVDNDRGQPAALEGWVIGQVLT